MLVNLRALLVRLIDIILLRGGPEQLPASSGLLAVAVVLYVAVSAVAYSLIPNAFSYWPSWLMVETVVQFFGLHAACALANKRERFLQIGTAYFGVSSLFMPAMLPISFALLPFMEKPDPAVPPPTGLTLVGTIIGIWMIVVQVRNLRAAFEWHWLAGLLFYFALNFASAVVYVILFAVPPGAT